MLTPPFGSERVIPGSSAVPPRVRPTPRVGTVVIAPDPTADRKTIREGAPGATATSGGINERPTARPDIERRVRGSFFADYVRMLRRVKNLDWAKVLPPEDLLYLRQVIDADGWYPMATFERFGVAILSHVEGATLEAVRFWGRYSVNEFVRRHPTLVAPHQPLESLMRLRVLRATLFDFPAFDMPILSEGYAEVVIRYEMTPLAEEAACVQTMGFCEGVLSLAGATDVQAQFQQRSYRGDPKTSVSLEWTPLA